jgi:hypothetical protein
MRVRNEEREVVRKECERGEGQKKEERRKKKEERKGKNKKEEGRRKKYPES